MSTYIYKHVNGPSLERISLNSDLFNHKKNWTRLVYLSKYWTRISLKYMNFFWKTPNKKLNWTLEYISFYGFFFEKMNWVIIKTHYIIIIDEWLVFPFLNESNRTVPFFQQKKARICKRIYSQHLTIKEFPTFGEKSQK